MAKPTVESSLRRARTKLKKGEPTQARTIYESILADYPENREAKRGLQALAGGESAGQGDEDWYQRASKLHAQGQFREAAKAAETGLKTKPTSPQLWLMAGIAKAEQKRWEEADEAFARLTQLLPKNAEIQNSLGNLLKDKERFEGAIKAFKRALRINPKLEGARHNLGLTLLAQGISLRERGYFEQAMAAWQESINVYPDIAESHFNLGVGYADRGELEKAIAQWFRAVEIKPDLVEALSNLGFALKEQGQHDAAIAACRRALDVDPEYVDAYTNLGNALKDQGNLAEAAGVFRDALRINPNDARAHYNLGNTLREQGALKESMDAHQRALKLQPDFTDAKWNLALISLMLGDYVQGWKLYEQRMFKSDPLIRPPRAGKAWQGQELTNKHLLVYGEQGIGDIFQFSRYLVMLASSGAQITFHAPVMLHHLLQTLTPDINLTADPVVETSVDFECPLMCLPRIMQTRLDTIPIISPYLCADSERISIWRETLQPLTFKIGICWQGGTSKVDIGRSFALSHFAALAQLPNVELISLHKGKGEEQLTNVDFPVTQLENFDSGSNAFADTAAVMECCDLIVTSDTAVAHLAGALNRPTWVVLKHLPDWRWLLERRDSPWYPSMTLYRQETPGDWDTVFQHIAKALQHQLKEVAAGE
ncbi:MAG: tetratricopeptide repeat protein [Pseudomonadales bacterium]|nr:tetratricopeptide repeat protein [Pseudomonadales bacterium]